MNRTCLSLAVVGAMLTCFASAPVSGAIVELKWTGTTNFGGNDGLDLFGLAGQSTDSLPYTATYVFDTEVQFSENLAIGSQQVSGGTFFDPDVLPVPLLSASISINGETVQMPGRSVSTYFRQSGQGASQISTLAQPEVATDGFGGELFQRVFRTGNFYDSPVLEVVSSLTFTAADNPGGNFLYSELDILGNIVGLSNIVLTPTSLMITVQGVPEPTSGLVALSAGAALVVSGPRRAYPRGR